jgi:hypothetical protein
VYAWIWRHLPFGLPGRIAGSLLLAGAAAALLWFVVFPWADPFIEQTLLPWDEGQLQGDFTEPGVAPTTTPTLEQPLVGPDGEVIDDPNDIPYETEE